LSGELNWTAKDFDHDQDQKHHEEPLSEETLHKTKLTDDVVGPKKKSHI